MLILLPALLSLPMLGAPAASLAITPDVKVVERERTPATLAAACTAADAAAWFDNGALTFCYRNSGGVPDPHLVGSTFKPLHQVGESDLWTVSLRFPGIERAVFGYSFFSPSQGRGQLGEQYSWRGPQAPPAPPRAEELQGSMRSHSLKIEEFDEERELTIYLPPDHEADGEYPVIYMADGAAVKSYCKMLEPLIMDGTIPPTIMVGVASAGRVMMFSGATGDWYAQLWYRDPAAGGSGFNLSDGLVMEFCP